MHKLMNTLDEFSKHDNEDNYSTSWNAWQDVDPHKMLFEEWVAFSKFVGLNWSLQTRSCKSMVKNPLWGNFYNPLKKNILFL